MTRYILILIGTDVWALEASWVEIQDFDEELDIQRYLFHTARRALVLSQFYMRVDPPFDFIAVAEAHNQARYLRYIFFR